MFLQKAVLTSAAIGSLSALGATQAFAQGGPTYHAGLNGSNECNGAAPPAGPICRKGDADGFGSATVTMVGPSTLCFGIVVQGLVGATAAHIHTGGATTNGAILVALTAPTAPGNGSPGATSGCVSGIASSVLSAIRLNPQNHYINVHNAAFPSGAVRGQLF